ncbi:MAG: OmpA family protein [Gammaproteobacteria bacterium]|nr:OmpA family protein [Gammaproteobacteria bacterium]
MFNHTFFSNKIYKNQFLKRILAVGLLASLSSISFAEERVVSFHGQDPSSDELVNAFMGEQSQLPEGLVPETDAQNGGMKYRGISLKKAKPTQSAEQKEEMSQQFTANQKADACLAGAQSVAVNIRFKSNSSTVENQDTQMLNKIAQAMNTPQLKNCFFVIEGHTDAVGEAYYNLWLSQKRADSVKHHLNQYNVESNRMIVVGKGEDELLNDSNPNASENRRVQFRVINAAK